MLRFLIEKEFKLIARNPFLPRMILFMPVLSMLILPFAADMEVKDINITVVDNDRSTVSQKLINKISSTEYFTLSASPGSYEEAMDEIERGTTDIILEIPIHFERDMRAGSAQLNVSANSVNATKGSLGSAYLSSIIAAFPREISPEMSSVPTLTITPQNRYNPYMNYRAYMVPALMVMLLTIMCGFMPALNIVGEKESGTIEQMNVTPVSKLMFILAKLIPYWIMGFLVLTIGFGLAWLVHGLSPAGNLITMYAAAAVFVLVMSGMGLVVSNNSQTMQQAMFVIFFFMLILLLLSGLFTPIQSMPPWAQKITIFNPLKYFIQVMRAVYLKGSSLADIHTQLIALGVFAVFINVWAVISYRKSS